LNWEKCMDEEGVYRVVSKADISLKADSSSWIPHLRATGRKVQKVLRLGPALV